MITKKTVLVLGAGASQPYGYPTGNGLMDQVKNYNVEEILKNRDRGPIWGYIIEKFSEKQCLEFYRTITRSGKYSVDAFLEHRYEFVDLGKAIMSYILISFEREDSLFNAEKNWYKYFYNKLNAKFDELTMNNVSVITFNYDRSLEYYLLTAIKNDYGKTEEEAAEVLKSIPIIHLYGNLGDLPSLSKQKENAREYSQKQTPNIIEICIKNIKIIHEGVEGDPQFSQAHELLSEAEVVCFLGFGYDKTNLERLKVGEIFSKGNKRIYGSSYGFTPNECMHISNRVKGNIEIDFEGANDALGFLRRFTPLD